MPSLKLTEYKPNMRDPRVHARVAKVLKMIEPMARTGAVQEVMAKDIRRVFGNRSSNPLAAWLYANLMRQEFWYSQGHHPYSYSVKMRGYQKVLRMLEELDIK